MPTNSMWVNLLIFGNNPSSSIYQGHLTPALGCYKHFPVFFVQLPITSKNSPVEHLYSQASVLSEGFP